MAIGYGVGAAAVAIAGVILLAPPAWAQSNRGVQFSSDGELTFVSKDVGSERFAITREADDTLTGNVFFTDGRDPAFIVCDSLGDFEYRCRINEACDLSACNTTSCKVSGEPVTVSLPSDFFEPTAGAASSAAPAADLHVATRATAACDALGGALPRGIQQSVSGGRVFVNKDVAGQRYAITKYPTGRVTGNIFFEDGAPPRFLDCSLTGNDVACGLADSCPPPPAPCNFVNASGNPETVSATLPEGFFDTCPAILEFIEDVRSAGEPTCLRIGAAPIPQPGAPVTVGAVRGNRVTPPGSTNNLGIDYDASAQVSSSAGAAQTTPLTFIVAVSPFGSSDPVKGYFELPLETSQGTVDLSVDISLSFRGDFDLLFGTSAGGSVSGYRSFTQEIPLISGPIGEGGFAHDGERPPGAAETTGGPPRL